MIGQIDIQHRGFVNNNGLRIQGVLVVFAKIKSIARGLVLQQSVHRQRRMSGRVGQTAGRSPRGRCQKNATASLFQHIQNTLDHGGFTSAGTACQHENTMLKTCINSLPLSVGQLDAGLPLPRSNNIVGIHPRDGLSLIPQI